MLRCGEENRRYDTRGAMSKYRSAITDEGMAERCNGITALPAQSSKSIAALQYHRFAILEIPWKIYKGTTHVAHKEGTT